MKNRLPILLTLLDAAFIAAMLAIPFIWLLDPLRLRIGPVHFSSSWGFKPVLITVGLLISRLIVRSTAMRQGITLYGPLDRGFMKKLMLSLVMTYLCFGSVEGFLAAINFRVNMAPVVFALDNEAGQTEVSEGYSDPELRWKFRKGEKYHGRMINSLGYRDREVDPVKKPGTIRVICLGDSVTAQGEPGYSQLLNDRLNANPPTTNQWEAFNMAVYGYSSMQGLRVFQLETYKLQPDFVTIYFGWNDHWLEMETDRTRMARKVNPLYGRIYNKLKEKRIFMLLTQLKNNPGIDIAARKKPGFRVPPDEYVQVMTELISEIRAVGATPIIITAARRDVHSTKVKFPEEYAKINFNEVHDQYMELTRKIAADQHVEILDLHRKFSDSQYDGYFMKDGIHFKQPGLEDIAEELDGTIRRLATKK